MTAAAFADWLAAAKPGARVEYHRGLLAWDREGMAGLPLDLLADAALAASDAGLVHLVQRRHGEGSYSYEA